MNRKICLILFGLLVALAVLASAENSEENSLSEEVASSRLAREAEAGKRKSRKNKSKKSRKGRKGTDLAELLLEPVWKTLSLP